MTQTGGSGAWSVHVSGINAQGDLISEVLRTAGNSPGPSGNMEFIRVFRAFVYESGTYANQSVFFDA